MADKTKIEWADASVNFWWGCTRVSPGCQHCYAESLAHQRRVAWGPQAGRKPIDGAFATAEAVRRRAVREKRRLRIFTNSMSDFFDEKAPAVLRRRAWETIEFSAEVDWLILTKRPENFGEMLPKNWGTGWSNVWLGVSAENQEWADKRIPTLLETPAAVRFVSYEPALGPIAFSGPWHDYLVGWRTESEHGPHCDPSEGCGSDCPVPVQVQTNRLDWVIVGGESGPGARPFDVAWARATVAQCRAAGVSVFVKQIGKNVEDSGAADRTWTGPDDKRSDRKGGDPAEWPEGIRVREFPCAR